MTHFSKFYNPSENLAIDKVIVSFKERVIFKQYIPKKCKHFGIRIFKLCDSTGYTYDMKVYLGKDRQRTAQHVKSNPCDSDRTEEEDKRTWAQIIHGQFLFFPWIVWWLGEETDLLLWHCQAKQERHATRPKTRELKRGDIHIRTRADLMAILWRDKRDVCMLTNIHSAPAEGNFCNEGGKAIKLQIVMDYNHRMGYVDKGDRMANNTFKWTKKLFFHLLDLAILNSYILCSSCGSKKMSHKRFSIYPSEEYVGTCWTRTENTKAVR